MAKAQKMRRKWGRISYRKNVDKYEVRLPFPVMTERGPRRTFYFSTETKAEEALTKFANANMKGRLERASPAAPKVAAAGLTVLEAIDQYITWKESHPDTRPKTLEQYQANQKRFAVHPIAKMRVDDVTTRDVEVYIAWRSENIWGTTRKTGEKYDVAPVVAKKTGKMASAATVNRDLSLLSGAFSRLIRHGWTGENPVARAKKPSEKSEDEREGLEGEQAARLLDACDERLRPFVAVGLYTGARRGEIASLRWSDLDLSEDSPTIKIRRTKTKNALLLPINPRLLSELLEHRTRRKAEMAKKKKVLGPAELVFLTKYGNPYTNFRRPWKKAVKAAELNHLTWLCFHSMRHTFAYLYLRGGGGIRELQKILGHGSITTTEKYLRKVADDRLTASMLMIDLEAEKRRTSAALPKSAQNEGEGKATCAIVSA